MQRCDDDAAWTRQATERSSAGVGPASTGAWAPPPAKMARGARSGAAAPALRTRPGTATSAKTAIAPRARSATSAATISALALLAVLLQSCDRLEHAWTRSPAATDPAAVSDRGDATGSPALATLVGQAAYAAAAQRIELPNGEGSARRSGTLAPGAVARFVFGGMEGGTVDLSVTSSSGAVSPGVAGDDGTQLIYPADRLASWRGALPTSQDYHLTLLNVGASNETYDLRLDLASIDDPAALPDGIPQPQTTPTDGTRATDADPDAGLSGLFSSGVLTRTIDVAQSASNGRMFTFQAVAGEVLSAAARGTDGVTIGLLVEDPAGRRMPGPRPGLWRGPLPLDGTYVLSLSGGGTGAVTLAAGLSAPILAGGGIRPVSGEPPWLLEGEVRLPPGQVGGDGWTIPAGDRDQLEIVLTEAPDDASAVIAVWTGPDRAVTLIDPAVPGAMHLAPAASTETVVMLLWSGGARGRTVAYSARIQWR